MRILITGYPKAGKSTLAAKLAKEHNLTHLCTDPQGLCDPGVQGTPISLKWSEQSEYVAKNWIGKENTIVEGTALPRALRKWKDLNPGKPLPCDKLILLNSSYGSLLPGQASMGKGLVTVLDELRDWIGDKLVEQE